MRDVGLTPGVGCQNLRYSIVDLESFELIQEGRVPLPRNVRLTWAGFSQEGVSCHIPSHRISFANIGEADPAGTCHLRFHWVVINSGPISTTRSSKMGSLTRLFPTRSGR